ncbi:filamentous hemagglutinin N-terminal domain-containing protein [Salmonella enterica]|nr:filamentous hemagglutinin N-terminal domain-containing protein [Salmonella enterica]EHC1193467.1 filamentous hemagglutinin N-terminal domain-containing protein [Salmonella enterica]
MNKIYRLKFDRRRNELVVVSEITAGTGKKKNTGHIADLCDVSTFRKLVGTLTPLAFLTGLIISLFPVVALANPDLPTGGQIVGGQGSISTSGNQMTIHQQTQNMATNWQSFDIGKNNTVQFVQPDSSSVALNRVTGASGSQIMGTLKANGQVFILNPNGVLFGKDARVSVAGLVASTKNINTADFMKGQYTLSGEGNPGAQVINQGSLTTTKGGYIVLAADQVKNSGTITTPSGKTVLAAGKTVTLQLDNGGLTSVSVDGSVVNALVDNRGLISATNGQVFLTARGKDMLLNTVVNNSGTIEAKGLESRGGEIVLNGGDSGVVNQTGQLLADSHAGPGGKITVEGQNIHLAANSRTSATGKAGGGEVYVGGGWQGKDSHIRNASKVVMDKTATVDVSATDAGNGGTAVLWSDDYTNFRGAILAKGGALSGDGGRVETSSHNNLQAFGDVDTSASAGLGGEWLLDPLDVTIVSGDANTGVTESGKGAGGATLDTDTDHVFSPSASGAQVSAQKISDQLNNGTSVTVETHGDGSQAGNITFNKDASVKKTAGGDATLTLKADRDISFKKRTWISPTDKTNGAIVSTVGKLNLNLLTGNDGKNGTVGFEGFVRLHLNGGDAFIGPANPSAGNASVSFQNDDTIDAGNITLNTAGGVTGNNYGLSADKNLTVNGPLSLGVNSGVTSELKAGGLLKITAGTGDISFSVSGDDTGNKLLIEGKDGVDIRADNGQVKISGNDQTSSSTIKSTDGNIYVNADTRKRDGVDGVFLNNASLSAGKDIHISGITGSAGAAGVKFQGDVNLTSAKNVIDGKSVAKLTYGFTAGVLLNDEAHVVFVGDSTINAESESFSGFLFNAGYSSGESVEFRDGSSVINATDHGNLGPGAPSDFDDLGAMSIVPYGGQRRDIEFKVSNASLNITAESMGAAPGGIMPYSYTGDSPNQQSRGSGFIFTGQGDINIKGTSVKGAGVDLRVLDNRKLNGKFTVNGESESGVGVIVPEFADVNVVNAAISGSSGTGVGIQLNSSDSNAKEINLQGNTLTGTSVSGSSGVQIKGNNVSVTNGTVNGTVSNGTGTGVLLYGNTDYTISGATVTGQSLDGAGVSAGGSLTVNDGAVLKGTVTGSGSGVVINGDLKNTDGRNVVIAGKAESGDGIQIAGNSSLINAFLAGESATGTGVNVAQNLTVSGTSTIKGTSDKNTGVSIARNLTVIPVTDSGGAIISQASITGESGASGTGVTLGAGLKGGNVTGISVSGTGVELADNADIKQATLKGNSTKGSGVTVSGKVTLDDATAKALAAGSDSGSGLTLSEGADVHIVQDGTTEPVTDAVVLSGTSGTGSAVTVDGNAAISGVILKGETTAENGTGVTVKNGKLTLSDALSGVEAGATGNGTGLVISDGAVDAGSYKEAGKDFVIGTTVTGDGTAISISGNSSLSNVALNGTATGNGSAVVVSGSLSTDKTLTATSQGQEGTGLQLSGGHLQGTATDNTPVKVVVSSTGDGTAVRVTKSDTGQSGSGLSGITLAASAGRGPVLDIAGDLVTNADISVSTENGTAISLNGGSLQGADAGHPVTVTAGATGSGTAVTVKPVAEGQPGSTLANVTLNVTSVQGDALNVGGKLNTKDVSVAAATTGAGTALNVSGGEIHSLGGTDITATSDSGHAAVVNDGKFTGDSSGGLEVTATTTTDSPALNISGASEVSNSVLSGKNSGNGSAVTVAGTVTSSGGGEIKGQTVNGTAVETADGTSVTAAQDGGLLINATATGDKGTGVVLTNATLTGSRVHADVTQGDAVTVTGSLTGGKVSGYADGGNGLNISNAVLSDTSLSGTTQTGKGTVVAGSLKADANSSVSGTATEDGGDGVSVSGSVTGGKTEGHATGGTAVSVAEGSTFTDTVVNGEATTGTGVSVAGEATLTNAVLNGTTQTGTGAAISGTFTGDKTSQVTGVATQDGGTGVTVSGSVTGGKVDGHATSGAGVHLDTGTTLNNVAVSGGTESGKGVDIAGGLVSTGATTIAGHSTGAGTGVDVAGNITGGSVTGNADGTGTGVTVSGQNVTVSDVVVSGNTEDGTGVLVSGGLSGSGTVVNGQATGGGTGVQINGTLAAGIKGSSSSGTGVLVSDGANIASGSHADGSSVSGTGVVTLGNVANHGSITGQSGTGTGAGIGGSVTGQGHITGTTNGTGNGVNLAGNVSGGTVAGHSAGGTGVSVTDTSVLADATVSGDTLNGTGVHVTGSLTGTGATTVTGTSTGSGAGAILSGNVTGGIVNGNSADGVGVSTEQMLTLNGVTVNGTSASQSGVLVSGHVESTGATMITGSSASDAGVRLNGTVSGGSLTGHSVSGPGVHVTGDSHLNGVEVSSSSESGEAIQTDAPLSSSDSTLNGQTLPDMSVPDTSGPDTIRQAVYREQGVTSHTERLSHPAKASGPQGQDKPVSVEICEENRCSTLVVPAVDGVVGP